MLVGVPREIKDNEYRVGIVPSTVRELADKGHQVVIETQAGAGAGFLDGDYQSAGAQIVPNGDSVFGRAELIVKVKEPLAAERKKLSRGRRGGAALPAIRSRYCYRTCSGRDRAKTDLSTDGQSHEARYGHRRCRHRSRWLRRDLAADHPFASDLCGRQRRTLLRD